MSTIVLIARRVEASGSRVCDGQPPHNEKFVKVCRTPELHPLAVLQPTGKTAVDVVVPTCTTRLRVSEPLRMFKVEIATVGSVTGSTL